MSCRPGGSGPERIAPPPHRDGLYTPPALGAGPAGAVEEEPANLTLGAGSHLTPLPALHDAGCGQRGRTFRDGCRGQPTWGPTDRDRGETVNAVHTACMCDKSMHALRHTAVAIKHTT